MEAEHPVGKFRAIKGCFRRQIGNFDLTVRPLPNGAVLTAFVQQGNLRFFRFPVKAVQISPVFLRFLRGAEQQPHLRKLEAAVQVPVKEGSVLRFRPADGQGNGAVIQAVQQFPLRNLLPWRRFLGKILAQGLFRFLRGLFPSRIFKDRRVRPPIFRYEPFKTPPFLPSL